MGIYNPLHPGKIIKETAIKEGGLTITSLATQTGLDRKTISRLVNGRSSVTVDVAFRLSKVLGTTPNLWLSMQQAYDIWQLQNEPRMKKILAKLKPLPRDKNGDLVYN